MLQSLNIPPLRVLGMKGLRCCRAIIVLALITAWSCSLVACVPFPLTRKHGVDPEDVNGRNTALVKPVLADQSEESSPKPSKKARDSEAPADRKPSIVTPLAPVKASQEPSTFPKTSKAVSAKRADRKTPLIKPLMTERPRERSSAAPRKDQSEQVRPVEPPAPLVKPKLTERPTDGASPVAERKRAGERRSTVLASRAQDRAAFKPPRRSERIAVHDSRTTSEDRAPLIRARIPDKQERRSAPERVQEKGDRGVSMHPSIKADRQASLVPSRPDSATPAPRGPLFQKPDHRKYSNQIKNKAIDLVNRESHTSLARLCKDSITDEWSLTLYRKGRKTFSFIIYSWDPIDEQWHESLDSGERPLSLWNHHIKFSVSGRDCDVLKRVRR